MDIVGGGVGSLCEAYRDATRFDRTGHHVNLLFDHETDAIKVESNYTHDDFAVTLKKPGPLWIRIPSWVNRRSLTPPAASRLIGDWIFIRDQPDGKPVVLTYALAIREIVLNHRSRDIRVRLRRDTVQAMDNFDADLTFFSPID
jgi:hypothetical protein